MNYVGLVIANKEDDKMQAYVFRSPEFKSIKAGDLIVVNKRSGGHEVMVVDNYIDLREDSEEIKFFLAGMGVKSLEEINTVYGSITPYKYKEESEVKE